MDKREIIDIKGLPVYLQADVVVCGGGTAGVFAAVAAAIPRKVLFFIF